MYVFPHFAYKRIYVLTKDLSNTSRYVILFTGKQIFKICLRSVIYFDFT